MSRAVRRPARRPPWRVTGPAAIAVAVVAAIAVSGCLMPGLAGMADSAKLDHQAQAALARWADAVAAAGGPSPVVVVGELTGQVGDWEPEVGDNKEALYAGLVTAPDDLSTEVPSDGEVLWPDGTSATVPVLSAPQAVAAIQTGSSSSCADCAPMVITAARLVTGPIATSRGPATGPVWEFTVKGTAVRVTRVAVAKPITVTPPPWDPNDAPSGLAIESAEGTIGGQELTVAFVGAPSPGDRPCGEDYTAEAVESDLAVVVIVTRHPNPAVGACLDVGARRTATATLAAPLGERAVLEVQQGLPVPVVLTP